MTRADRLQARNVQIYDLKNPETILGGLYLAEAQQMATSSLYTMLDMLITVENPADNFNYFLQTKDGLKITRDNNIFKRGTYYLNATGKTLPLILSALRVLNETYIEPNYLYMFKTDNIIYYIYTN